MSNTTSNLVLPRPGTTFSLQSPIPGPSESFFTSTFGALLPPAQYLQTENGKAAYYSMPPSATIDIAQTPDRVLLIHGVQTPAIGMLPLTRVLQNSFPHAHFVLIDLWGHGLSDTPVIPHEAAVFHGLFDSLLDHLQWPSAHLIGFSFGGSLTVGYTASRPSRVSSFTLVAPAGLIRIEALPEEDQHNLMYGVDEDEVRKLVLRFLEGGELIVPGDWQERVAKGEVVAQAVKEWQMREHPGHTASVVAMFRDGGAMYNHDNFGKAARTGIPSLVVLGENDDLCTEEQLRGYGFKDVFVVPQAGHGVVREQVPEVAGFITNFWNGLEDGSGE
jgi:pimeloyl-ACP methyl ester carboxylesterase